MNQTNNQEQLESLFEEQLKSLRESNPLLDEALRFFDREAEKWKGQLVSEYDCANCCGDECITIDLEIRLQAMLRKLPSNTADVKAYLEHILECAYPRGEVDDDYAPSRVCIGYRKSRE